MRSTPVEEVEFGSTIPSNFVFSPDGRYLYGSTYFTGASNIFRYELATDAIEAVSNTETGLFRPIPLGDDKLIVFRYTGEGFVPATIEAKPLEDVAPITFLGQQIANEYPVVKEWSVGSPAEIDLEEEGVEKGDYHGFKNIGLESVYPIIQGYRGSPGIGFRINFSDPLMLNRLVLLGLLHSRQHPRLGRAAARQARVRALQLDRCVEATTTPTSTISSVRPTGVSRATRPNSAGRRT